MHPASYTIPQPMAAIKLRNIKIRIILFVDALCYNALNNGIAYHSIGN